MSVGEFNRSFMSCRGGPWVHSSSFNFQFVHRFWAAEEDMDCLGLFLEFSQIGSGIWQVPYPTPAAKDGRGDVHLCPADVANGADQARRVIKLRTGWLSWVLKPHRSLFLRRFCGVEWWR